jgi:hypothetical protein
VQKVRRAKISSGESGNRASFVSNPSALIGMIDW